MYSKDFSKIYNQNIEVTKVLHKNLLVWSSGFDGDFTKVDLWELGSISSTGVPTPSVVKDTEARTKDFHTIPVVGLNLLSINTDGVSWMFYGINVHFYNSDYSFISEVYINKLGNITLPSGAKYYKLNFYNGIGSQRSPLDIQVHVPEANIKFNPE